MRATFALSFLIACGLLSSPAASPDDPPIRDAINRGVKFLKKQYESYPFTPVTDGIDYELGRVSLAGLALLESDVPGTDPLIQKITKFVRENVLNTTKTYDVSLALMYLDRLGLEEDRPMIQLLGLRILVGQNPDGGWGYICGHPLTNEDKLRLQGQLKEVKLVSRPKITIPTKQPKKESVPRDDLPNSPKKKEKPKDAVKNQPPDEDLPALNPEIEKWLPKLANPNKIENDPIRGVITSVGTDHSNTQFACLGLWIARRHGVPVDVSLVALEKHFRLTQNRDGGWNYSVDGLVDSSGAMTCAGLIGLATGQGVRGIPKDWNPNSDKSMQAGFSVVGNLIALDNRNQPIDQRHTRQNYYLLWSIERAAMIYGVDKIAGQDWYAWGSEGLLKLQKEDGSWTQGTYSSSSSTIDACLALLFLNRANLAKDLTNKLRRADPKWASLKSGKDITKVLNPKEGNNPTGPSESNPVESKKNTDPRPETKNPPTTINPPANTPPVNDEFAQQAERLANSLIQASASEREAILNNLRDSKGAVYTEALARATTKSDGDLLRQVRDALASRLTRMTAKTLREMLKDENREIRRGAALAGAMKEDKELIPDLITTLADKEVLVVRAARAGLKSLSGVDFGPDSDASAAEKIKAINNWRSWWEKQKEK
jgi:hypothetical protein